MEWSVSLPLCEARAETQVMSLRTLADEVSRVSLEVGSEGKLGGQAEVPDVEGVWKDLTVNVRMTLSGVSQAYPRSIECVSP